MAKPLLHISREVITMSAAPPYLASPPDLWIPIPNTRERLPLTWDHTRAIQRLARFFAKLFFRVQQTEEQDGLAKYQSWMMTLFQMDASIHEGIPPNHKNNNRTRLTKPSG
jgi:hypothetical protein